MKEQYQKPELEIVEIDYADVMTVSPGGTINELIREEVQSEKIR